MPTIQKETHIHAGNAQLTGKTGIDDAELGEVPAGILPCALTYAPLSKPAP
jgi:hypothetical protein